MPPRSQVLSLCCVFFLTHYAGKEKKGQTEETAAAAGGPKKALSDRELDKLVHELDREDYDDMMSARKPTGVSGERDPSLSLLADPGVHNRNLRRSLSTLRRLTRSSCSAAPSRASR